MSLSATTFANTGSGYGDYKAAVEATMLAKNATVAAQYEVTDQGAIILSGTSTQKLDNKDKSSQTSVTVGGVTKAFETSAVNGNVITEADGKYFSTTKGNGTSNGAPRENLSASSSTVKLAEMLADTLVGDVKNQFVENGQTISVNLQGAQIPELAQLALSAAAENSNHTGAYKNSAKQGPDESMKPMMDQMPKLTNVNVTSLAMTATVDGTTLKDNDFTVAITGNDATGVAHELTIKLNANITDVGSTKIEAIDTTGQQVTTIVAGNHSNK
ncbi:MAG: hypothetical protein P4L59_02480 [Desulfosporosinus sp.]|nr:hypothetical protein [Desulfosporosinus sp.]